MEFFSLVLIGVSLPSTQTREMKALLFQQDLVRKDPGEGKAREVGEALT